MNKAKAVVRRQSLRHLTRVYVQMWTRLKTATCRKFGHGQSGRLIASSLYIEDIQFLIWNPLTRHLPSSCRISVNVCTCLWFRASIFCWVILVPEVGFRLILLGFLFPSIFLLQLHTSSHTHIHSHTLTHTRTRTHTNTNTHLPPPYCGYSCHSKKVFFFFFRKMRKKNSISRFFPVISQREMNIYRV